MGFFRLVLMPSPLCQKNVTMKWIGIWLASWEKIRPTKNSCAGPQISLNKSGTIFEAMRQIAESKLIWLETGKETVITCIRNLWHHFDVAALLTAPLLGLPLSWIQLEGIFVFLKFCLLFSPSLFSFHLLRHHKNTFILAILNHKSVKESSLSYMEHMSLDSRWCKLQLDRCVGGCKAIIVI